MTAPACEWGWVTVVVVVAIEIGTLVASGGDFDDAAVVVE